MYINDADMLVTPDYQYVYSLPHDDVIIKIDIIEITHKYSPNSWYSCSPGMRGISGGDIACIHLVASVLHCIANIKYFN